MWKWGKSEEVSDFQSEMPSFILQCRTKVPKRIGNEFAWNEFPLSDCSSSFWGLFFFPLKMSCIGVDNSYLEINVNILFFFFQVRFKLLTPLRFDVCLLTHSGYEGRRCWHGYILDMFVSSWDEVDSCAISSMPRNVLPHAEMGWKPDFSSSLMKWFIVHWILSLQAMILSSSALNPRLCHTCFFTLRVTLGGCITS